MKCKNHMEADADYACSSCGQPLCLECTVEISGRTYCKECLSHHLSKKPIEKKEIKSSRKSKFLTFLLSFLPGTGHMYLGLLNKGLTMMLLFFSTLFLAIFSADALSMSWYEGFFIPVSCIVFITYSIFDALAVAEELNSGKTVLDSGAVEISAIKDFLYPRRRTIGCILVIFGFIGVLNVFSYAISQLMFRFLRIHFSLSSLLFPVLMIMFGLYLIRRGTRYHQ